MKICYYNPQDATMPIQEVLKEVCLDLTYEFVTGIGNTDWMSNCDVAIIHGRVRTLLNEQLKFIGYSELTNPLLISKPNQTLIFISHSPLSNKHQKIELSDDKGFRYLLPVKNTMESGLIAQSEMEKVISIENWKKLLKNINEENVLNKWFDNPSTNQFLSELFIEQDSFYLEALAILSQAFLAAFISTEEVQNSAVTKVAISDMGIDSKRAFLTEQQSLGLQNHLSKPEWWRKIFYENKDIVKQKLVNEWVESEVSPNVIKLLDDIYSTNESAKISAEVVAKSYLDIAKKLRKQ